MIDGCDRFASLEGLDFSKSLCFCYPSNLRYVVIKKLGWGHFSTVWMVKDRKAAAASSSTHFFALKVQKSAEHYTEAAMDEVELLDCISKERKNIEVLATQNGKDRDGVSDVDMLEYSQYVATLHDSFFHTGPNGRHMCMVFSVLGCNLLSVIKAFNYRGIPIPVVKNMIKGICKGLDFLHRKCSIIHTDLKPENVLLLFEGGDEDALSNSMANMSLESNKHDRRNSLVQSIVELERALENQNLTQDERKKLRRKLKKKRQKERKRNAAANGDDDSSGSDESDDDMDSVDDMGGSASKLSSAFLSDWEMSKILSNTGNIASSRGDMGISSSTTPVKRRLNHSAFVTSNFGHREEAADAKLMDLLREKASSKRLSVDEIESDLKYAEKHGGVAEVSFAVRAFTPEEELADCVSSALGGIKWDTKSTDKSMREW